VQIPDVEYPAPPTKAAFVVISLAERKLQAFDASTNLLAHFPCSIAAKFEKRPVGELHVTAIAPNPDYTFNPEVFPESEEARQLKTKLILPPGPNNPVGTAWISLDRPGYGMHGTPSPEQVGRTESHGCFRLANWNAEYLIKLVSVGTPVLVEP
jgi:lipoprotein-anchoring transpeptidase ErfK/SrfK